MRVDEALLAALHPARRHLPVEGTLPSFDGATGWIDSQPLTPGGLRGKVVLVEFLTYTCINWLRTMPYVRAWADKYREGLVVIGVHTPEFPFERDLDNVRVALKQLAVDFPIAVDSEYGVWEGFDNHYWPALYFADAEGRIRHHHFGEGEYEQSEMVIQHLLEEAGLGDVDHDVVSVDPHAIEVGADWGTLGSPESYLGYERSVSFASPGGVAWDERRVYAAPSELMLNGWALSGDWTVSGGDVELNEAGGRIAYRFHARDVHLVMGPGEAGSPVRFRVLLDGEPAGTAHGADVDEQGNGTVVEPRLYQLIRQRGAIADRTFEIEFLDPGVRAFVFTFG